MAWVRLDDQFADHPKVATAGPLGMAMHVAALCYANRHLTDGFIPRSVAKKLLDLEGIAWHQTSSDGLFGTGEDVEWHHLVADLVDVGMWHEVDGGWEIHDYHDYQPSSGRVKEEREAAKERMRRVRAERKANKKRSSEDVRPNDERSSPNPVPGPVPDVPTEHSSGAADASRDELFETVAAVCGIDWRNGLTKQARGALNSSVEQLREIGTEPEDVPKRAKVYRKRFPDAALTPSALAKHWPSLGVEVVKSKGPPEYGSLEWEEHEEQRRREVEARADLGGTA